MIVSLSKVAKSLLVLGLTAFLLFGFFGVFHSSMAMDESGGRAMSDCPFMSGQAVCNMNPLGHIAAWQSMYTALPREGTEIVLLLLLVSLGLGYIWARQRYIPIEDVPQIPERIYNRKYIPIANQLQELFSSGILNPKPY